MATNIKFHRITATPGSNIKTDQDYVKGDVYFIKSATDNTGKVYICTVSGRGAAATLEDYSVDTNTWRPVENNLTSTSTDSSLSAAMGKTLNESITTLSNSLPDLSNAVQITYAELKSLRDAENLVPGQQYRIIDYDFTTTETDTDSAHKLFDIIVTADSESVLNENARAIHHQHETSGGTGKVAVKLYKTDVDGYGTEVDYEDYFLLAGPVEVDGVTYYRYDKYELLNGVEENTGRYILLESTYLDSLNISLSNPLYPVGGGTYGTYEDNTTYITHQEDGIVAYAYEDGTLVEGPPLSGNDLASWELKYTLDNVKHSSADGKGTVLWMKDEFRNECNYDFINALFKVYEITACPKSPVLVGTYAIKIDSSSDITWGTNNKFVSTFGGNCYDNIIRYDGLAKVVLGNNCFSNTFGNNCYSNSFGNNCYSNSFESGCHSNTFGNNCYSNSFESGCHSNTFGNDGYSNIFGKDCNANTFDTGCGTNTFRNYCSSNSFGSGCRSNTFGNECNSNSFGNNCYSNSFGNNCYSNSFGNNCCHNTFGIYCYNNTFEDDCYYNTFGTYCNYNTFGVSCYYNTFEKYCYRNTFRSNCNYNTFGVSCYYNTFEKYCNSNTFDLGCGVNTFGDNCSHNTFGDTCQHIRFVTDTTGSTEATYYQYNKIDRGVQYVNLYNGDTTSAGYQVQNYHIVAGVKGTSSSYVNIPATRNLAYETKVAKNSAGELKIYCEADLIQ